MRPATSDTAATVAASPGSPDQIQATKPRHSARNGGAAHVLQAVLLFVRGRSRTRAIGRDLNTRVRQPPDGDSGISWRSHQASTFPSSSGTAIATDG